MAIKPADGPGSLLEPTIRGELEAAGDRAAINGQAAKKNHAEVLSRRLAERLAGLLRGKFPTILPQRDGSGHESRARSSKGIKKLDVNYSTTDQGLGLGVSIKTINYPDAASGRYTKNFTRVDAELRAEASDYHERQPWAVMIVATYGARNTPVFVWTDAAPEVLTEPPIADDLSESEDRGVAHALGQLAACAAASHPCSHPDRGPCSRYGPSVGRHHAFP